MKYISMLIVLIYGLSQRSHADTGDYIELNSLYGFVDCRVSPDHPAIYESSVEAGWARIGLGEAIEQIESLNPNVNIETHWKYGVVYREVEIRFAGSCKDVTKAVRMFLTIH